MNEIRGIVNVDAGNLKPVGAVIHNDAGSRNATARHYAQAMQSMSVSQLENGFAHYYIDRNDEYQCMDLHKRAWGVSSTPENGGYPNANLLHYEVNQSIGATDAEFLANEDAVFRRVARDFIGLGIQANTSTIRLHNEFMPTACPHRSMALHGNAQQTQAYFISRVKHYMNGGGEIAPIPPKPVVPAIKIVNLWDYTGKDWLPKIQKSYVSVVANDRVFGVKMGTSWRARMIHVTNAEAIVICKELRKIYPKYTINGARINVNDKIVASTPFAVEVDGVSQAEIDNVIRYMRTTYAGIITGDRIFLTPQNDKQVILEIHHFDKDLEITIKNQLKSKYGIADKQFK